MTDKDFTEIEFNPLILKEGELMQQKYAYFKKREIFSEPLSVREEMEGTEGDEEINGTRQDDENVLSDLLKFVVLFIDMDSPFWDDENYVERQTECLRWAKIKKSSRAYHHVTKETFWYQQIITEYFKYVADGEYEEWISKEISIRNMNAFLREPFNSEDPEKSSKAHIELQKNIGTIREALDKLKAIRFPKNKKIQRKMIQYHDNKESIIGHAEKRAKTLKN